MDIIIIAGLAALILYKLYNVLGRRTGHDQMPPPFPTDDSMTERMADRTPEADERAAPAARDGEAAAIDGPLKAGLAEIRQADRSFNLDSFLAGARTAFEGILDAFHKGELEPVRPLLTDAVHRSFAQAIAQRDRDGTRRLLELVAVNRCEAVAAVMKGREAHITVRFESDQTDVVKDSEERIVAGDPTRPLTVSDAWTFARDTRSQDPNWRLVATRSPD